jgi:8-oxo-dGTP pyrophosphatase MutT (NUDIX family)
VEILERDVVRAVVLDSDDRVLLLHTHDPTYPEQGTWWELPGGGMDPDETPTGTIIRELAEEAGLAITAGQVGPPNWRRRGTFRYRGRRLVNNEVVVLVRLGAPGPAVRGRGLLRRPVVAGGRAVPQCRAVLPRSPARAADPVPGR